MWSICELPSPCSSTFVWWILWPGWFLRKLSDFWSLGGFFSFLSFLHYYTQMLTPVSALKILWSIISLDLAFSSDPCCPCCWGTLIATNMLYHGWPILVHEGRSYPCLLLKTWIRSVQSIKRTDAGKDGIYWIRSSAWWSPDRVCLEF